MRRLDAFLVIAPILLIFNCGTGGRAAGEFGADEWLEPRLVYVIPELACSSCIEQLRPFVAAMAGEGMVQMALIVSPDKTDTQGFAASLDVAARNVARVDFLGEDRRLNPSPPMMYLLSKKQEIIFARPITFAGHDMPCLKSEIVQLMYEFGS